MVRLVLLALLVAPDTLIAQSRTLDIYWIDVEGGAATLIVAPSGESMLVDTGYETDGRDAKRIHAAAQQAGLSRIQGGIHFLDDITVGQDLGVLIGQQAWDKAQTYFNGTAQ